MSDTLLVRYGAIPEVARFACRLDQPPARHERVVVQSHRGPELGTTLDIVRASHSPLSPGGRGVRGEGGTSRDVHTLTPSPAWRTGEQQWDADETVHHVLRRATAEDEARHAALKREAQADFSLWQARILEWKLSLELLDLEWTLDRQKLVLYVLGGRGAETTRLALQAAAAGLAVIEVQPVGADGPVPTENGGCGSGGCGCGH